MKMLDRILSPNWWVMAFSFLAVIGLVLSILGFATGIRRLIPIGLWFGAPLIFGGIILIVVVIPIVLFDNWNRKRWAKKEDGESDSHQI